MAPSFFAFTAQIPLGKDAVIWVKIMMDMPLPIPRSVISSPIHMMMLVPAVITNTMVMSASRSCEYKMPVQPCSRRPVLARVTNAVAFMMASTRVR